MIDHAQGKREDSYKPNGRRTILKKGRNSLTVGEWGGDDEFSNGGVRRGKTIQPRGNGKKIVLTCTKGQKKPPVLANLSRMLPAKEKQLTIARWYPGNLEKT